MIDTGVSIDAEGRVKIGPGTIGELTTSINNVPFRGYSLDGVHESSVYLGFNSRFYVKNAQGVGVFYFETIGVSWIRLLSRYEHGSVGQFKSYELRGSSRGETFKEYCQAVWDNAGKGNFYECLVVSYDDDSYVEYSRTGPAQQTYFTLKNMGKQHYLVYFAFSTSVGEALLTSQQLM